MTVTLETLRADFEAARQAWAANETAAMPDAALQLLKMTRDEYLTDALRVGTFELFVSFPLAYDDAVPDARIQAVLRGKLQANLIDVFMRYGPKAAMAYKLSDGAIDPRVQP